MAITSLEEIVLIALPQMPLIYIDILGLTLVGVGMGMFTPPNNSSVMGSIPPEHVGVAGGILNMSRSLGMCMGVAIAGTIYNDDFQSFHLINHTLMQARILSFHESFAGMAIIGIIATFICFFFYNRSKTNKIFTGDYI